MTALHPVETIDVDAAVAAMVRSYVTGLHWDARAVRERPELLDAIGAERWQLLDVLAEENPALGQPGDFDAIDGDLEGPIAAAVADWMPRRAAYALDALRGIVPQDGLIPAWRAVQCAPTRLRPALGVHWCWDPEWSGGADVHWPDDSEKCSPTIMLHALVPVSSVDWDVTLLCSMDYVNGDDERELRVRDGAPLRLLSAEADGKPLALPAELMLSAMA